MLELDGTVIAVIINFLLLVWILNRVLYKPVLKLIEDRQNLVAASLGEADRLKTEGEAFRNEYQQKIRKARLEEQKIIEEATRFADQMRQQGLDKAHAEAEEIRAAATEEAAAIKKQVVAAVKAEFVHLTMMASEKMIGQRLDEAKNSELILKVVEGANV